MALTKQIEMNGSEKIDVICRLISVHSEVEVFVIKTIFALNEGKPCGMDTEDKLSACFKGKVNPNTFDVSLSRLTKKGVVAKIGKLYQLHPIFIGINETESITIKWK